MKQPTMVATPFNVKNAIDTIGFVLSFDRTLEQDETDRLLGLESVLKDELPVFAKLSQLNVKIEPLGVFSETPRFSGVLLQKFTQTPGRVEWSLKVTEQTIQITCGNYDRWQFVLPKALNLFDKALTCLNLDTLAITAVGCQIIDKFIYSDLPQNYSASDVFNLNSEYLSNQVKGNTNTLWHLNQGWFDQDEEHSAGYRILNQLNLSNTRFNETYTTTIENIIQKIFVTPLASKSIFQFSNTSDSLLSNIYCEIHEKNKDIILKTLSKDKLNAIGLTL